MDEKERLRRYYKDCLWVRRMLSPLRGLAAPFFKGSRPAKGKTSGKTTLKD